MELLEALGTRSGVVCVVGAGGKKSTLYTLAAHATTDDRHAVVTATVRIPIFDSAVSRLITTPEPAPAVADNDDWPLGVVPDRDGENRYRGYDPSIIDELAAAENADLVLVKADGARTRELKAPDNREPQLPDSADIVCPIASVQVVGEPLTEAAVHRPERVSEITGLEHGEQIAASTVGTVIASVNGGLKRVPPDATVIPILNKVDNDRWLSVAHDIADVIHEQANVPRVLLTRMLDDEPLVDVVT